MMRDTSFARHDVSVFVLEDATTEEDVRPTTLSNAISTRFPGCTVEWVSFIDGGSYSSRVCDYLENRLSFKRDHRCVLLVHWSNFRTFGRALLPREFPAKDTFVLLYSGAAIQKVEVSNARLVVFPGADVRAAIVDWEGYPSEAIGIVDHWLNHGTDDPVGQLLDATTELGILRRLLLKEYRTAKQDPQRSGFHSQIVRVDWWQEHLQSLLPAESEGWSPSDFERLLDEASKRA